MARVYYVQTLKTKLKSIHQDTHDNTWVGRVNQTDHQENFAGFTHTYLLFKDGGAELQEGIYAATDG